MNRRRNLPKKIVLAIALAVALAAFVVPFSGRREIISHDLFVRNDVWAEVAIHDACLKVTVLEIVRPWPPELVVRPYIQARQNIRNRYGRGYDLLSTWRKPSAANSRLTVVAIPLWAPAALLLISLALAIARRTHRQRRRLRTGLCIQCGYNLTGNESGICPECGRPTRPPAATGRTHSTYNRGESSIHDPEPSDGAHQTDANGRRRRREPAEL